MGNQTEQIEINGLKFKVRDIFDKETVSGVEILLDRYRVPKEPKVVIDIGAHIGGTSILCASRGATIYAFEPEKENYEILVENIKLNHLEDRIKCFKLAVSSMPSDRTQLFKDENCNGGHSLYLENPKEYEYVNIISLEKIFIDNKIEKCDFLKMDCEDAELEILVNCPNEIFDRISQISMEIHKKENGEKIERFLADKYRSEIYKHLYHYFYKRNGN